MKYKSVSWATLTLIVIIFAILLSLITWVFLGYMSGVIIPNIASYSLLLGIIVIICFIFWLVMLVDSLKRSFKIPNDKFVWVLVIVFTWIIGAVLYYFMVKSEIDLLEKFPDYYDVEAFHFGHEMVHLGP